MVRSLRWIEILREFFTTLCAGMYRRANQKKDNTEEVTEQNFGLKIVHIKVLSFYCMKKERIKNSITRCFITGMVIVTINPYWQHFGTITECHFRKQNPENFFIVTILVTSYIEHLKSCYHISKQQGVFYLYQKYFKHVTSSSAEICVGFCFRDLPIWVKSESFAVEKMKSFLFVRYWCGSKGLNKLNFVITYD